MSTLPFAVAEYEVRLERVQRAMAARQLDGLVVTSPPNFRYLTGVDTQFWESPARPWFLLVPASGPLVAVVPGIAEVTMRRTVVERIHTWESPAPQDEGVSLLASVLTDLPRRHGAVGFELGRESVLRMPVLDFMTLGSRLPGVQLVDGSLCLWQARNIKSAAEVERIRSACQLVGQAFNGLRETLEVGMTEADACRDLMGRIVQNGAHAVPYMSCGSGPGGYEEIISRGSDRALRPGDVLMIDVGATVDGYFCDFDRNYALGTLDPAAVAAHHVVWDATEAGIRTARAGIPVRDLFHTMMRVLQDGGMRGNSAGRLGHGLGLQLTELPSHSANDDAVLEPGMVITIEPGMEYAPGRMIVHEENVVITSDGYAELLTDRAPRDMWVVG